MISQSDLAELVNLYPWLVDAPPNLRQALIKDGQLVSLPAGRVLFDVGDPCHSYLFLSSGAIRVTRPGPQREILLYYVRPGESCIAAVCCLLGTSNFFTRGEIESELRGVEVPAALFKELLARSPACSYFVVQYFAAHLPRLIELIGEAAFMRLDQRLAVLLLSRDPEVKATHQKLADELGSAREVISRILEDFEKRGMLQLERGRIRILDRPALEKIASLFGD